MTAAGVAETLAREYPKTVVSKDGAHLVLRPSAPAPPATVVLVAEEEGRVAATTHLDWSADPVRLTVTLERAARGRRLGTWMLLDGVHLAAALGATRVVVEAASGADGLRAALRRIDFVEDAPGRFGKTLHHGWTDF